MSQLLKPQEAADRLKIARTLLLKWLDEGRLPFVIFSEGQSFVRKGKVISGRRIIRIKESELEQFIRDHENKFLREDDRVTEGNAKRLRLAASRGAETKS